MRNIRLILLTVLLTTASFCFAGTVIRSDGIPVIKAVDIEGVIEKEHLPSTTMYTDQSNTTGTFATVSASSGIVSAGSNTVSIGSATLPFKEITVYQVNNPFSTNSYWKWNSATQLVIRLDIGGGTNIFIDGRE